MNNRLGVLFFWRTVWNPVSLFALMLILALPGPVLAEVPAQTVSNPKPAEGDLILPMPGDAQMVFRRVAVPGKGFWGDQARVIQVGDASGGVFEGLQRTQISGSFPGEGEAWDIILAKYEVTRGQYVAVMGMDACLPPARTPRTRNCRPWKAALCATP